MKISKEFSKYAGDYESRNSIQNLVAKKLLSLVEGEPKNILDLGCGSGVLYKNLTWECDYFCGVDFAEGMLSLHPKESNIELIHADFNDMKLFEVLSLDGFDYLLSSSALQWAVELETLFEKVAISKKPFAFAIFSANTFKTLNETASLKSILRSPSEIESLQKRHLNANFETLAYKLEFKNTRDMFSYIKRSGVSGARNVLGIKEMKELMRDYPLNYLEFEVVFISS